MAGEKFLEAQGYAGVRTTVILNMHLLALGAYGTEAAFEAAKPKLFAVKNWLLTVQATAAAGSRLFPAAPYPFEAVVTEK